jgi:hypothetical protein
MKWIKTYNEAIGPKLTTKVYDEETGVTQSVTSTGFGPDKFRKASQLAIRANQTKKSDILKDYADEKEFGYYNVTVLRNRTGYIEKNIKVTDLKIGNIRYGVVQSGNSQQLTNSNWSVEDNISRWENGEGKLGLTFDVSVRLLNSSKKELLGKGSDYFHTLAKSHIWVPFSISLVLSNNSYGVDDLLRCDDCDGEGKWHCYECDDSGEIGGEKCKECEGKGPLECSSCNATGVTNYIWVRGEKIKIEKDKDGKAIYDAQSFFEDTKLFSLEISPKELENGTFTGVFSDKRSAIEFTKDLPKAIAKSDEFKKKITEMIGILSHEPSEDLEKLMSVFTKISNNRLLPEDPKPNETFYNSYFYKKIAEI